MKNFKNWLIINLFIFYGFCQKLVMIGGGDDEGLSGVEDIFESFLNLSNYNN
jgi:hypothetical protein